eukprot:jgi/Chlat1/3979/Chrsp26S04043
MAGNRYGVCPLCERPASCLFKPSIMERHLTSSAHGLTADEAKAEAKRLLPQIREATPEEMAKLLARPRRRKRNEGQSVSDEDVSSQGRALKGRKDIPRAPAAQAAGQPPYKVRPYFENRELLGRKNTDQSSTQPLLGAVGDGRGDSLGLGLPPVMLAAAASQGAAATGGTEEAFEAFRSLLLERHDRADKEGQAACDNALRLGGVPHMAPARSTGTVASGQPLQQLAAPPSHGLEDVYSQVDAAVGQHAETLRRLLQRHMQGLQTALVQATKAASDELQRLQIEVTKARERQHALETSNNQLEAELKSVHIELSETREELERSNKRHQVAETQRADLEQLLQRSQEHVCALRKGVEHEGQDCKMWQERCEQVEMEAKKLRLQLGMSSRSTDGDLQALAIVQPAVDEERPSRT